MSTASTKVFGELFDSAMKFFDRAVGTFESEIDVSIVHFAISLELTVKSLLVLEHWAFIFENPGKATLSALHDGSLKSVQFKDAMYRVNSINPNTLTKDEFAAYSSISNHRNRIVHYTHSGLLNKNEIDEIKISILKAWYYLHSLLNTKILIYLDENQCKKFKKIYLKMRRIEDYWKAVFLTKEHIVKKMVEGGANISTCSLCKQNSARLTKVPDRNFVYETKKCVVCDYQKMSIHLKCMACGIEYSVETHNATCPSCGILFFDGLEVARIEEDDYFSSPVYCADCHEDEVYRIGEQFLCAECYNWGDSLYTCEYCNTTFLGDDIEDSFLKGCEFCDGRLGELASRDD